MKRAHLLKTIFSFFLLLIPAYASARESWTSVRSKNFVLIGNAGESEIRKVATRLELFRQFISQLFPHTRIETPVPTTVIVFKNHDSFKPFKPKYNGKTQELVGGYFLSGSDVNYIAVTTEARGLSPYEVIFHEFEHFIIENNLRRAPLWLNEGLAEFYSTFDTLDGDQKIMLGKFIGRHLAELKSASIIPLKTLLTVDHNSPYYRQGHKMGIFYAEAWALVHYLMLGNQEKRQPQLSRFISQLNTDVPLEESFRQSFQTDYKGMEDELRSYISRFAFPAVTYRLKRQLDATTEMQSAPMSEAEVQYYLGDLLLCFRRFDEAEERLQKSVEMDPHFAASRISLGVLRLSQHRPAEARKLMQAAIAIDPRNYLGHYYYAYALAEDRQYDEAVASYKQSIALRNDVWKTHAELGYVYLRLGRDDEALASFQQAVRLEPRNQSLYRSISYACLRMARGTLAANYAMAYIRLQGWRDKHSPYMILAAYFGYRQSHADEAAGKILDEASGKLETSDWPYPVVRYLQHAINMEELLKQATDNDKLTEAHAYAGLDLSLGGNRDAALPHLRWVKENGNKNFVEYPLALAELGRIEGPSKDSAK